MMANALQLTLAIVKPHAFQIPPILRSIHKIILANNFFVVDTKRRVLSETQVKEFYSEHEGKFFYPRLIHSMSSGPCELLILARENAIIEWRELMGPTRVYEARITHPDTIRGKYGLTDTRNATHGSDSEKSARRELNIVFPDFDIDKWYQTEERHFRDRQIIWKPMKFVHVINANYNYS